MPRFRYIAVGGGVESRGIIGADTKREAIELLRARGYRKIRIRPETRITDKFFKRIFGGQ